jgi:hypothetical protein
VKLVDLDPRWISGGGRVGLGVMLNCPGACCQGPGAVERLAVWFENPLDGGAPGISESARVLREGETFETLTLARAEDASRANHARFTITDGEVVLA